MTFPKAWQAVAFAGGVMLVASELVGDGEDPGIIGSAADIEVAQAGSAQSATPAVAPRSSDRALPAPQPEQLDYATWLDEGDDGFAADADWNDPAEEPRVAGRAAPQTSQPKAVARAKPARRNTPPAADPAPLTSAPDRSRRNLSPEERARLVQPAPQSPADSEQRLLRDLSAAIGQGNKT